MGNSTEMKIGIVTTWYERGAAYVSRQYADVLSPQHDIFIYERGGERPAANDPAWEDGYKVTWGKRSPLPYSMAIDKEDFLKWIRDNGIETVFFNEQQWWRPVLWCDEIGIKTGAYVDYYTEETVPFFAAYDFLICNTKRHAGVFDWHPQSYYVPWGTDLSLFTPKNEGPVKPGKAVFFHSCGMSPERKGTDLVITAFDRMSGPSKLVVHSQVDLKRAMPHLSATIERLTAEGRIELIEKTVPAPGCYHRGDIYVYPSRLDGIGLSIAEALASGLPVITTDNPPMNEFLGEESGLAVRVSRLWARADGYYWPQSLADVDSLKISMEKYASDIGRLPAFKMRARKFAEARLDWKKNAAALPSIFEISRTINKEQAIRAIREHERSKETLYSRITAKYPPLAGLLKAVSRSVR